MGKNEEILCISRSHIPPEWLTDVFFSPVPEKLLQETFYTELIWYNRSDAEYNYSLKQIIPYLIICNPDGKIACYNRAGSETRLHGLWSAGVGGHVDKKDETVGDSLMQLLIKGATRELHEEFCNPQLSAIQYCGIINEEKTKVGQVHLGVVFLVQLHNIPIPSSELKDLCWLKKEEIPERKTELWSTLALELLNTIKS